jgi:copper(I)-binding protein
MLRRSARRRRAARRPPDLYRFQSLCRAPPARKTRVQRIIHWSTAMKSVLLAAMLAFAATAASAHEYKAGSLEIKHPWSRATPKGATIAGGYMKIINTGTTPDRLIGGSTAGAGKFEIHEMSMDNGVMKMRPLPNGVEIKPGATVEFKPGSYHLMFVGINQPFEQGKRVKGTLEFEKAGKVDVEYAVEAIGGTPKGEHDHSGAAHQGH